MCCNIYHTLNYINNDMVDKKMKLDFKILQTPADSSIITKQGLSKMISKDMGTSITDAENFLTSFGKVIESVVSQKKSLKLHKLFSIEVVKKPARNGTNPRTLEKIKIPSKNGISIKASDYLKKLIK